MAQETHDFGRAYWHTMDVPRGGPHVELGTSHEVEEPWRVGRCVVLRVWHRALVLGWWGPPRTYDEMLEAEGGPKEDVAPAPQIRESFRGEQREIDLDGWVVR